MEAPLFGSLDTGRTPTGSTCEIGPVRVTRVTLCCEEVVREEGLKDRTPILPTASKDGKSQRVWFSVGFLMFFDGDELYRWTTRGHWYPVNFKPDVGQGMGECEWRRSLYPKFASIFLCFWLSVCSLVLGHTVIQPFVTTMRCFFCVLV